MTYTFGGVPTRKRNTAGPIADKLAEVCDEVVILSQGAKATFKNPKVRIEERYAEIGMMKARNELFNMAMYANAEYIIQSDDDLNFNVDVLEKMLEIMEHNHYLAAISSCPRVYANWEKNVTSTKPFLIFQCPTQLWVIRMEALAETGFLRLDVLEDIELGLRLWKNGWILGKLHLGLQYTHNPFISRMHKGDNQGGQPVDLRNRKIPSSVEYIAENHGEVISNMRVSMSGNRSYTARYNWGEMCRRAVERWGHVGYQDSKKRSI